jgi:hypothetical protein
VRARADLIEADPRPAIAISDREAMVRLIGAVLPNRRRMRRRPALPRPRHPHPLLITGTTTNNDTSTQISASTMPALTA